MKTFFILGRNPKLSRAEILEFLKARSRTFEEILFTENLLIIETPDDERFNIQEFGGTLHLGKITFEGTHQELEKHLSKEEIIPSDKFTYAVYGDLDPQTLQEKFKSMRKKASQKHGKNKIKYQDGKKAENPKADFHILFHSANGEMVYLGIANQSYSPEEVKKRDMQKPVRREALSISPRLSKILINLSGAKPYSKTLDPFCGIGGILSEALIKNIHVHGIDKDKDAIKGAKENIAWLKNNYKIKTKYSIENLDSRKAPDMQFDAMATETPLGKLLKKKPSNTEAQKIIQNFESLIIPILTRLKKVKKPEAKIAITFPVVKEIHTDYKKIAQKSGLEIYIEPILESREDQFVSRDILVLK